MTTAFPSGSTDLQPDVALADARALDDIQALVASPRRRDPEELVADIMEVVTRTGRPPAGLRAVQPVPRSEADAQVMAGIQALLAWRDQVPPEEVVEEILEAVARTGRSVATPLDMWASSWTGPDGFMRASIHVDELKFIVHCRQSPETGELYLSAGVENDEPAIEVRFRDPVRLRAVPQEPDGNDEAEDRG